MGDKLNFEIEPSSATPPGDSKEHGRRVHEWLDSALVKSHENQPSLEKQWQVGSLSFNVQDELPALCAIINSDNNTKIDKDEIEAAKNRTDLSENNTYALTTLDKFFPYFAEHGLSIDSLANMTPKMLKDLEECEYVDRANRWVLSDKSVSLNDINLLRDEKQTALEKDYQVSFSNEQTITYAGRLLKCRRPELFELVAAEGALKNSYPAYKEGDKGIRIFFLNEAHSPEASAIHVNDFGDGKPAILVETKNTIGRIPTESLALAYAQRTQKPAESTPEEYRRATVLSSLEGMLRHELGHSTQQHIGWYTKAIQKRYYHDLGWIDQKISKTDSQLLLKSKEGKLYKNVDTFNWMKVSQDLRLISTFDPGLPEVGNKAASHLISAKQLRKREAIEVASEYFPNPGEQASDGLSLFRGTKEDRKDLLHFPHLYKAVKKLDQEELNRTKGVSPKFVRDIDSSVKPYSKQLAKEIAQFEKIKKAN